jgi:hypothetical protein
MSTVRKTGAGRLDGAVHDLLYPQVPHFVHEEARDAALSLPGELFLPAPVAAKHDLDVALGIYASPFDEPAHYGPVGERSSEDLRAGVGVGPMSAVLWKGLMRTPRLSA